MSRATRRLTKGRQSAVVVPARGAASRLQVVGLAVLCMKLAVVPLVFDPSADVPFVLPRTLLSHGLTYVLVGVLLALFVARGSLFLVRSWVHVLVLAFFGVSALATVFALNPIVALFGTHVRMLGLTTVADGVVTYFAVVHLVRQRRAVVALVLCLCGASLIMLAYEAIQLLGKDPFTWANTSQRPFSTLGQATTLGEFLTILSMGGFALGLLTAVLPARLRAGLIAYSGLLLLAAGLTGTRAAALGVAAAAGTFVIVIWTKHPSRRARQLGLISGLGAAALLTMLLLATPLGSRLTSIFDSPNITGTQDAVVGQLEPSTATRLAIYEIALRMVAERPVLGYGPDNFAVALPALRPEAAPPDVRQSVVTSTHSWIAAIATSSGVLGLAVFLAIIGSAARVLLRSEYSSLGVAALVMVAAYLAAGAVTINALETDTLFWLGTAGIVATSVRQPLNDANATTNARRRRPAASRSPLGAIVPWLMVVAAIAVTPTTIAALDASRSAKNSISARAPATVASAIDLATRATHLDPNRAEYWQQLALAFVVAGRWSDASVAFQKGAALAPYDIRYLTDDIQVQLVLVNGGDGKALDRAAQLADQAVRLDPNNPYGYVNKAVVAFQRRDLAGAVESIDRALVLDPNSINSQLTDVAPRIYLAATQSDVAAGRINDAIVAAEHGIAVLGSSAGSVPLRLELARALVRNGRSQEAVDVINAALALAPADPSLLQLKQEILRTQ
jgi:O-antigen ligase/tetratricopeptide (TPR) repeat protein